MKNYLNIPIKIIPCLYLYMMTTTLPGYRSLALFHDQSGLSEDKQAPTQHMCPFVPRCILVPDVQPARQLAGRPRLS